MLALKVATIGFAQIGRNFEGPYLVWLNHGIESGHKPMHKTVASLLLCILFIRDHVFDILIRVQKQCTEFLIHCLVEQLLNATVEDLPECVG